MTSEHDDEASRLVEWHSDLEKFRPAYVLRQRYDVAASGIRNLEPTASIPKIAYKHFSDATSLAEFDSWIAQSTPVVEAVEKTFADHHLRVQRLSGSVAVFASSGESELTGANER